MTSTVKKARAEHPAGQLIDLDAAALLADERAGEAPALERAVLRLDARPRRARPAPLLKPTAKKSRRDPGRDELLSEYLSSLGRVPLLSPEDERELAARFRDAEVRCWQRLLGVAAVRELVGGHALAHDLDDATRAALAELRTAAPESALARVAEALRDLDDDRGLVEQAVALAEGAIANDARALRRAALELRNRFVRANLRLVVSVARRFHHYRLPLIDLIQEGNLGLIKGVHRFDHRKGFRFSTYAHWWIRQAIERAIMNKGAQVRLPVHVFDARREMAKATRDLQRQLGRDPTIDELARELCTPREKLEEVMRAVPREPQSLDDAVGDDEERTLGEVICDEDDALPDERVIQVDEEQWVRRCLTKLSPMEVDIITRRFGLERGDDETLEEIGRSYQLSRERVRQIQVQGLKKMQRYVEARL
ncbi:MAG: sigma-70 family RNA polymerase sigma factor [Deltaproteobacteria bacterium]|nr:sigma-70 family RNA polymerase sigma factor [Deltaproteobacteria bacterium]